MFNMNDIGKKIARLRKGKNITQMELADKIGVSFQAVSNWERGETMPDISKLPELALIFGTSIDDILNNEKGTHIIQSIIEDKAEEYMKENKISAEEISNVAPILKADQNDKLIESFQGKITIDEVLELAPFMSDEAVDKYARKTFNSYGMDGLIRLAPFMSEEAIDECAEKAFKSQGLDALLKMAPFIESETIDKYVWTAYEKEGITRSLVHMCPFIEEDTLSKIAIDALSKNGFKAIKPLLPFIDEEDIDEFVRRKTE